MGLITDLRRKKSAGKRLSHKEKLKEYEKELKRLGFSKKASSKIAGSLKAKKPEEYTEEEEEDWERATKGY